MSSFPPHFPHQRVSDRVERFVVQQYRDEKNGMQDQLGQVELLGSGLLVCLLLARAYIRSRDRGREFEDMSTWQVC